VPLRSILPDWYLTDVSPNTAPTDFDFRKRAGTSTVAPALGDDVVGKFLNFHAFAFQHGDLHATFVVKVHMERRLREIMPVMKVARESLGQVARLVVVDVDQSGNARTWAGRFNRSLLQPGSGKVAQCFGAIIVAACLHVGETLHRLLPDCPLYLVHSTTAARQ
jgi:hypothetical protein